MKRRIGSLMATLALAGPSLALAHHSLSGQFDTTRSFQITGVVSRVDWINPHTQVFVDVKQANGATITYKLESLPVAMMRKSGLSKNELLGDGRPVVIDAYPARGDTPHQGYLLHIKLADGREIQFSKVPGAEQP